VWVKLFQGNQFSGINPILPLRPEIIHPFLSVQRGIFPHHSMLKETSGDTSGSVETPWFPRDTRGRGAPAGEGPQH